jgi:hypothetical protein
MTDPDGPSSCEHCSKRLNPGSTRGRRKRFCNATCRSAARREREARASTSRPPRLLFAETIAAALRTDGRPLRVLAKALPKNSFISPATLSQWQTGHAVPRLTEPNVHRLYALERLIDVPTGRLVQALATANGQSVVPPLVAVPGPRRSAEDAPVRTIEEAQQRILRQIAALDEGSDNAALPIVVAEEHYFVGDRRRPLRSEVTLTVSPLRDGIKYYWVLYSYGPMAPLRVAARANCSQGYVLDNIPPVRVNGKDEVLVAAQVKFPPLTAGEEFRFSFDLIYDHEATLDLPEFVFRRFVTTPATRELRLDISFDPKVRPRELRAAEWRLTPADRPPTSAIAVKIDDEGRGEPTLLHDPRPAAYGYTWTWPTHVEAMP